LEFKNRLVKPTNDKNTSLKIPNHLPAANLKKQQTKPSSQNIGPTPVYVKSNSDSESLCACLQVDSRLILRNEKIFT
jgi:hypothetical protein